MDKKKLAYDLALSIAGAYATKTVNEFDDLHDAAIHVAITTLDAFNDSYDYFLEQLGDDDK